MSLTANPFAGPKQKRVVSDEQKALRALLRRWDRKASSDFRFFLGRLSLHKCVVTDSYALRIMDGADPAFTEVEAEQVRVLLKKGTDAVFGENPAVTVNAMRKLIEKPYDTRAVEKVEAAQGDDGDVFYRFTDNAGHSVVVRRQVFVRAYNDGDQVRIVVDDKAAPIVIWGRNAAPGAFATNLVGLAMPYNLKADGLEWIEVDV